MKTTIIFFTLLCSLIVQGQHTEKLQNIITKSILETDFEGVVVVAKHGEPIVEFAIGFQDASRTDTLRIGNTFKIASITKSFTAIIIMQLVQEGKLNIDDNLAELLPDLDIPRNKKITINDLLLHTSGLPNEDDSLFRSKRSPKEMLMQTLAYGKMSKYGRFHYSNLDYFVLSLVIQKITGISAKQNIIQRIIDPLELNNTGFLVMGGEADTQVVSFTKSGDEYEVDPQYYIENFDVAAGMYSNAADLLTLDQALYTNRLLTEQYIEVMYKSHPEIGYVAYGNWVYNYPYAKGQPKLVERRGGLLGFNCALIRFIEQNKTIIILSNNGQFDSDSFGKTDDMKEALIIALAEM